MPFQHSSTILVNRKLSDYCLDVPHSNTTNGNAIVLWECHGGNNQRWILDTAGRIISKLDISKCLDAGTNPVASNDVFISDCNGADHQSWTFQGDGRISNNAFPSLYVGVADCGTSGLVYPYAVTLEELDETGFCSTAQGWVKNPGDEVEFLKQLYDATGGATIWKANNWFDEIVPFCDFDGLTCNSTNEAGLVSDLYLDGMGLSGKIPTSIALLEALQAINLSQNTLIGSIPTELGQLTILENVELYSNSFSGYIPSELGQLSSLKNLDLDNNNIIGTIPTHLGQLKSLEELWLVGNALTGLLPSELGLLANIREIYVNDNDLTGPIFSELGNLHLLTIFQAGYNKLTGVLPPDLGSLASVTDFSVHNNRLSGNVPSEMGSMTDLTILRLELNDLTGVMPTSLCAIAPQFSRLSSDCSPEMICGCCTHCS